MKVIGYYSTEDSLLTSDNVRITKPPYLGWLLKQEGDYHVCYHLDHFVACLCRLIELDKWEIKKLVDKGRLKVESYYLSYTPGKFFSVKQGTGYGRPYILLSDASKFLECTFTADIAEGFKKAEEARLIGVQLAKALVSLGLNPSSLVSPIRAWEKESMGDLGLPTRADVPEQAEEWAYEACKGSWVEAFKRGHWEKAWDWDINSAYPYFAMNLPRFEIDDWEKDYDGDAKTTIGIYRCIVDMEAPFHPVLYKKESGESDEINFTPTGKWEDCLSLNMIRHIEKYKLGTVRIIEGYCLKPAEGRATPLRSVMKKLYQEKNKENGIRREAVKRIMTGIYGKLLEVRLFSPKPFGPYFNSVWAMEIECNTRIEVSRFCLDNKVIPMHIAVDGVLTDKKLKVESSAEMGKWRISSCCPALVIGSGQVAIQDKVGTGEFKMDYDWLMEHGIVEKSKLGPITLPKALQLHRPQDIGKLETTTKKLDLNSEAKRCYRTEVKDWEDFLSRQDDSSPWDVSMIADVKELV